MSHPEQRLFFRIITEKILKSASIHNVLEIGSYDVNGETRNLFPKEINYTGVDLTNGPGVDIVAYGHEIDLPDGTFDLVLSAECFEHDSHWEKTLTNMIRLTKPGGYLVFSCASRGRPEHGTVRTDPEMSPGTQAVGSDYYQNIDINDLSRIDLASDFLNPRSIFLPNSADLYFYGRKKIYGKSLDQVELTDLELKQIKSLMPISHKIVRFPLRLAVIGGKESKISREFSFRYWKACGYFVSRYVNKWVFQRTDLHQ